jgi:cysteine desulfurase
LEREGFEVTYLDVGSDGLLDLEVLRSALRDDTVLLSVMHVNNEIGVIQDIEAIGAIARERKVLFHVDAAQSTGKVSIDLSRLPVDLMSFSAHKSYGPKGIGALYVRRKPRVRIEAQMHGGGHERGMRSGTLAPHQIVGMGEAFRIAREEMGAEVERIRMLRDRLWSGLSDMEEVYLNGDLERRIAGNLNVSFNFVEGESLIMALKDIAVSSGSACTSASLEPSYVLRAWVGMMSWRTVRSVSPWDVTRRPRRWTTRWIWSSTRWRSCASSRRCGRCTRRVWISRALSGRRTDALCASVQWQVASGKSQGTSLPLATGR